MKLITLSEDDLTTKYLLAVEKAGILDKDEEDKPTPVHLLPLPDRKED